MGTGSTTPRRSASWLGLAAGVTTLAGLLSFFAGQLVGEARHDGEAARADHSARTVTAGTEPGPGPERRRRREPLAAVPTWPAAPGEPTEPTEPSATAAPDRTPRAAAAELLARASEETLEQLEVSRQALVNQCWPARGLPGGRSSARLTFNVVYDATGREVGRGISEDRRAPAGELARCLRRIPAGSLRISPIGTSLGVKVALNLP